MRSNQTAAVPRPQVAAPSCTISWSPGKVHEGWFGHCGFEEDPNVTYRRQWRDAATGDIVSKNEYEPGPRAWIHGGHKGRDIVCIVTAERDGYRSNEVRVAGTVPAEWEPAG